MNKYLFSCIFITLLTLISIMSVFILMYPSKGSMFILYVVTFGGMFTAVWNYILYKESKIKRWDK
jgi:hypothetical protein